MVQPAAHSGAGMTFSMAGFALERDAEVQSRQKMMNDTWRDMCINGLLKQEKVFKYFSAERRARRTLHLRG
jgi:hypothetical protein